MRRKEDFHMFSKCVLIGLLMTIARSAVYGQGSGGMQGMPGMTGMNMDTMSGATNDFFVMAGSDFSRRSPQQHAHTLFAYSG
jgi:hypothetical protein